MTTKYLYSTKKRMKDLQDVQGHVFLVITIFSTIQLIGNAGLCNGLILPPADKIKMGMVDMLEDECWDASDGFNYHWEIDCVEGYQLATSVFKRLAECERKSTKIWLPSFLNRAGEIGVLVDALNSNSDRLGGLESTCEHWPEVPASVIELTWKADYPFEAYEKESKSQVDSAIEATETYVDKFLVKLGLCPFTQSVHRSAIGLESVGVKEGPVIVKHCADTESSEFATPAAVMAAMYWEGVTEIIERPEEEVSTHLLLAPSCYDDDFVSFCKSCDNLLEKTVRLSPGSVGRVWFHPYYDLDKVGGSKGGHAPPVGEIEGLIDNYISTNPSMSKPDYTDITRAHDKTRWTPHATINLLRTSQLRAAKDKEDRGKVFAKNIFSFLKGEKTGILDTMKSIVTPVPVE